MSLKDPQVGDIYWIENPNGRHVYYLTGAASPTHFHAIRVSPMWTKYYLLDKRYIYGLSTDFWREGTPDDYEAGR